LKKKQTIIAILTLVTISSTVYADQIYHTQKLGNGQVIKWCKDANGEVEPCTYNDTLLYMDTFNNPLKYMTPAQRVQYEKNIKESEAREAEKAKAEKEAADKAEAIKNSIIGNTLAIERTINYYGKNLEALKDKRQLGVPINEAEYDLLAYKINALADLKLIVTNGWRSPAGLSLLMTKKYEENLNAYEQGKITQEEFQYLMADLKRLDESLKVPYEQIKALTVIPVQPQTEHTVQQTTEVQTANYASTQHEESKEKSNSVQSTMFNVRNNIDEVNNVTNSVNNGLFQIKALFGY